MSILIDLIILAIVAACVWLGYKRGVITTAAAVLVLIVSLAVANAVANRFSGEFVRVLEPFVSGLVDRGADSAREQLGDDADGYDFCRRTLENTGIYAGAARSIAEEAAGQVPENGGSHEYRAALADTLCRTLSYAVTMTVVFILLIILFTVVGNIINLEFRLPGLDLINGIVGMALGIIKGFIIVFFIAWLASFAGVVLKPEIVGRTLLLRLFMNANPLAGIFGI